jgi:hypothetical protein
LSHDSKGTIDEITAAAKATGTRIVGFTEHPDRTVDVVAENVTGWRDGVYFLAGTESSNELHWPGREGEDELRFVAHPEDVPTFDRDNYDGMEIYNTHSDAIDEPIEMLLTAMVVNMVAVRAHPEAAFCSFLDWPEDFLARFDRLTTNARFSGIAANDSHQNQGFRVIAMPTGRVEVTDTAGQRVWQADGWQAKAILTAFGRSSMPAERVVVASLRLDPYEISMRHVGTFLQIKTIDEHSVRSALREGRIVLGFELVAPLPAVGFWMEHEGVPIGTVGDEIPWKEGMKLHVKLPAEAEIRVVRNGTPFADVHSDELVVESVPVGVYRMGALQKLAGERYPWVISNPIYVVEEQDKSAR